MTPVSCPTVSCLLVVGKPTCRGGRQSDATVDLAQRMEFESEPVYALPTPPEVVSSHKYPVNCRGKKVGSPGFLELGERFLRITKIFIPARIWPV